MFLAILCTALATPTFAQEGVPQPQRDDAEFQKLDTMMDFLRNRNARDSARVLPLVESP